MAGSTSTTRLRATYLYYAGLVIAAAFVGPTGASASAVVAIQVFKALALMLVVVACLGRIWCSVFIAGSKDARIVTEGPYSLCRHPLYAFSFLGGVGLGAATGSLVLTAITALVLAALVSSAARSEERRLFVLHGEPYQRYVNSTPRWWPQWHAQRIPPTLEIQPRVFWKAFLDAGAFVLLFLLIDTARTLRETGTLPTFLSLI